MVRSRIFIENFRLSEKMRDSFVFKMFHFPLYLLGNESKICEYLDIYGFKGSLNLEAAQCLRG